MKIGILGSHGVGKTTLLNALRSEPFFKAYYIGNEVTRELAKIVPINQNGTRITQELIMHKHAHNILLHDNLLTDRTPLDCLLYSVYLSGGESGIDTEFLLKQAIEANKMLALFDHLFYIRPEFDIRADEIRTDDKEFSDTMTTLFEEAVQNYNNQNPTKEMEILSGSVRQRVDQVLETIGA